MLLHLGPGCFDPGRQLVVGHGVAAKVAQHKLSVFGLEQIDGQQVVALFGGQTLPEHWHPPVGDDPGKEETVRVVSGTLRFYILGDDNMCEGAIPAGKENVYTARHELIFKPGDQITMEPGTKHWFQAGEDGVVMYSFSSVARDVLDGFTDPEIKRTTEIQD